LRLFRAISSSGAAVQVRRQPIASTRPAVGDLGTASEGSSPSRRRHHRLSTAPRAPRRISKAWPLLPTRHFLRLPNDRLSEASPRRSREDPPQHSLEGLQLLIGKRSGTSQRWDALWPSSNGRSGQAVGVPCCRSFFSYSTFDQLMSPLRTTDVVGEVFRLEDQIWERLQKIRSQHHTGN
jgi:hypothetical protein